MAARVLLLTALAVGTWAQECDYYSNGRCIKAQVSASATIPFSPLFSSPPTFVYGIDELDANDIATLEDKDELNIPYGYKGSVLKAAWWLEYDNSTVNFQESQERAYYALALETNSSNPIGGSDNGCGDLLGSDCVKNLKEALARKTYPASYFLGGMTSALVDLYNQPLRNLSCPGDIFGDNPNKDFLLILGNFEEFAIMSDETASQPPLPPGNASLTHGYPQSRWRSLEEQSARGVVGITISWPMGEDRGNYSMADVTVEMVCLRVGSVLQDSSSGAVISHSNPSNILLWAAVGAVIAGVF